MCDYSLEHVASRPASVADRLVVTHFSRSLTKGFASVYKPDVAVCLRPGTEIAFDVRPRYESMIFSRKAPALTARFRQVNLDIPNCHHDALEFPNGEIVLVSRLLKDQTATVLQLPANSPKTQMGQEQHEPEQQPILELQ